jgi:hypothetical protein
MAEPDDLRQQADDLEARRDAEIDERNQEAQRLREEADARERARREQDEADEARRQANEAGAPATEEGGGLFG